MDTECLCKIYATVVIVQKKVERIIRDVVKYHFCVSINGVHVAIVEKMRSSDDSYAQQPL